MLFAVFSGLAHHISNTQLAPFVANMHTALWCLTAVSILGAVVSFARPKHVRVAVDDAEQTVERQRLERGGGLMSALAEPGATAPAGPAMRIGEVAELTGTTPRTIRYYEEIGLLGAAAEREQGKHRCYTDADVERIREIVRLRDLLGLSLDQLSQLLEAETARAEIRREYRETEDPDRQRELLEQAARHIDTQLELVRERVGELAALERELAAKRALVDEKLAALELIRRRQSRPATPVSPSASAGVVR